MNTPSGKAEKPDYGIDAPNVLRNLLIFGILCLGLGFFGPASLHFGEVIVLLHPMFLWTGTFLTIEGLLFLLYVKVGKFRHRDLILSMHPWTGNEQVLDVGCGRGLLLAGAAMRLSALHGNGHATGIDIWSNVDMGKNSEAATLHNLQLEGVSQLCTLLSIPAQQMPFPDHTFDVIVSNLCLHNISDRALRRTAVQQVARVLKPGGIALLSDFKCTAEYADELRLAGCTVHRRWGNILWTFPPLRIVIAHKPDTTP